jgi:alkylation response protein AidB-like acyl-CoA dehydrogenase
MRQASFAVAQGAHTTIGTLPIVFYGTDEQKQKYLPKLATGELIGAYALTEPGVGSDAMSIRTRATLSPDGKHYILNGAKQWISNAGFADVMIVFAKVDDTKHSAFIVESAWQGVSTGAEEKKVGIKGSSTRTVYFDNVEVPVENALGEIGKGYKIAFNILNIGRLKLGAGGELCQRAQGVWPTAGGLRHDQEEAGLHGRRCLRRRGAGIPHGGAGGGGAAGGGRRPHGAVGGHRGVRHRVLHRQGLLL